MKNTPPLLILLASLLLAGCAAPKKQAGNFRVDIQSSKDIQVTSAKAYSQPFGLVVTGKVVVKSMILSTEERTLDVVAIGPDGKEWKKLTTHYYPTPKPSKAKPQKAVFTVVMAAVPPDGSVIRISLTPPPKPETGPAPLLL